MKKLGLEIKTEIINIIKMFESRGDNSNELENLTYEKVSDIKY